MLVEAVLADLVPHLMADLVAVEMVLQMLMELLEQPTLVEAVVAHTTEVVRQVVQVLLLFLCPLQITQEQLQAHQQSLQVALIPSLNLLLLGHTQHEQHQNPR
jgi:hypothetical protein